MVACHHQLWACSVHFRSKFECLVHVCWRALDHSPLPPVSLSGFVMCSVGVHMLDNIVRLLDKLPLYLAASLTHMRKCKELKEALIVSEGINSSCHVFSVFWGSLLARVYFLTVRIPY